MVEPISDPNYWAERLVKAPDRNPHHAIYICSNTTWAYTEQRHRTTLYKHIKPRDSILDAGCAWGRLLDLLPPEWYGDYIGLDLTKDFLTQARRRFPDRRFEQANLLEFRDSQLHSELPTYDWAICVSIREMVIHNLGEASWLVMLEGLKKSARRILILEYKDAQKEEVIQC